MVGHETPKRDERGGPRLAAEPDEPLAALDEARKAHAAGRKQEAFQTVGELLVAAREQAKQYHFEGALGLTERGLAPEGEGLLVYTVRIPEERDEIITENIHFD